MTNEIIPKLREEIDTTVRDLTEIKGEGWRTKSEVRAALCRIAALTADMFVQKLPHPAQDEWDEGYRKCWDEKYDLAEEIKQVK